MSTNTDNFFDDIVKNRKKAVKQAQDRKQTEISEKKNQIIEKETNDKLMQLYIAQASSKVVAGTVKIKFNKTDNIYLFRTKKPVDFIDQVVKALMNNNEPKQDWLKIERKENNGKFSIEDLLNYVKFF